MRAGPARRVFSAVLAAGLTLLSPVSPVSPLSPSVQPAAADEWREGQYWLEEYGFRRAWDRTRGEGVTVAVIDTGIDAAHPDLTGQVAGGTDVSGAGGAEGTTPVGPVPEHGTLVASVLAGHGHHGGDRPAPGPSGPAATGSASASPSASSSPPSASSAAPVGEATGAEPGPDGVIGVAPEARLLSVSVHLGDDNPDGPSPEDQIAEAVTWAVDHGADVINMSLGSNRQDWPESWDRAFLHAEENDVVIVAAAGNRASGATTAGAPATIPGVLTVAGLNADGTASWDASTEGISIGVAAPAHPLVGAVPGGGHQQWQGTSGAAPLVAGLAALVRSAHPEMPAHQVIHRILTTARDAGVPGEDPVYGHGVIDAAAAVTAEVDQVDRNPMNTIADWIRVHRRAESPAAAPAGPPAASPGAPASTPAPATTALPRAAPPTDPVPGLQPALVLGTGLAVVALLGTGVVLGLRRRGR
ncbi:S8 family serine peptidase [Citricoccus sp.]|uniref:S8 family serine peptidase n=1 Tax=Citricoccus sp. TaxID=1978372 RepID=UPI002602E39F|nr:S8 family serine peptidase [Citricoccus sp.]HRO31645.1 S8 family serine peptidase [Citricoccus sp.]